jgi:PPK2 family polyphosphate:nucleotide phosphotransferase
MPYTHRIDGTAPVALKDLDPDDAHGLDREEAEERTAALGAEMGQMMELLYASGRKSLLILLQGIDTSGKDGTIRRLLSHVNVQSCRVVPFKVPTAEELSHDFLWRVHSKTPGLGQIVIFNRSHYEDVLVVRVHGLAPEEVWRRRYEHIRHFEELLVDADTILLKFFLHISKSEQKDRLEARQQDPTKFWKLTVDDWKERERWDDYTAAYEEALNRCGTPAAPWHVVPANHKWFRDLAVTETIVDAIRPFYDPWMDHLKAIGKVAKKEIEAYRKGK